MNGADLDRREFLEKLGLGSGGACLACVLGSYVPRALGNDSIPAEREVDFYKKLPERTIECAVCPRRCTLQNREVGFCRARTNLGGKHYNRGYAKPCIIRIDPVEKIPLNHVLPGTKMMTIAVGGCNMRCIYCQNWQQSQKRPDQLKTFDLSPAEVISSARKKKIKTIGFTYTEPVSFLEYVKDIAIAAKKARMKVLVGSAGYINPEPLLDIAPYVDAFGITLKGFDKDFYSHAIGAQMEPVLETIETIKKKTDCWLELVNLIVPTYNDDTKQIMKMVDWIGSTVGNDVPVHFARFVPMYKLNNLPRTPVQTLESACQTAKKAGLHYVYTSNIAPHEGTNTYCHRCHEPVIQRLGFKILEIKMKKGVCPKCKNKLPGIWK